MRTSETHLASGLCKWVVSFMRGVRDVALERRYKWYQSVQARYRDSTPKEQEGSFATMEVVPMAPKKRSKKGEGESRRGEDETREEFLLGVAMAITQGEEGRPRKKASAPSKITSQLRE